MVTESVLLSGRGSGDELVVQLFALQVHSPRPVKCGLYVRANVFRTHMLLELSLSHELGWLFARTTKDERSSGLMQRIGDILKRFQSCGIDRSHVAQTQNHDRRKVLQLILNQRDLL